MKVIWSYILPYHLKISSPGHRPAANLPPCSLEQVRDASCAAIFGAWDFDRGLPGIDWTDVIYDLIFGCGVLLWF